MTRFESSSEGEAIQKEQNSRLKLAEAAEALYGRMFEIKTFGEENLREIPEGTRVIFAPTHITDMDAGIAIAALAKFNRDLGLVREISADTKVPTAAHNLLIDRESLFSLPHSGRGDQRLGLFQDWINSPDFRRLEESRKDIVIGAYFDPTHAGNKLELSSRKGVGAVYLAQQIEAVIVPVAVNVYADQDVEFGNVNLLGYIKGRIETRGKKPKAEVHFGKPIQLEKIPGIERMSEVIRNRERVEFQRLGRSLEEQSEKIMISLAEMLPPEKRGAWKDKVVN